MTPETVVQIMRQALMTDLLAGGAAAGDRLHRRHRDQPGADRDLDAGQRLQLPSRGCWPSWRDCCSCCRGCCSRSWLHDRAVRETWAGMPANLTLSAGDAVRLSAGAGARRRRAGLRAAAGRQGRCRTGARRAGARLHPGAVVAVARRSTDASRHGGHAGRLGGCRGGGRACDRRLGRDCRSRHSRWPRRCSACRPDMPTPRPSIPTREADSGVLLVFAQLMGGMLFFAMGLDREVLRLFAQTLETIPAGATLFSPASAERDDPPGRRSVLVRRALALPVVALLLMVDVALALLGRLNAQLQLLTLAFPLKMLTALLVLSWIAAGVSAHAAANSAGTRGPPRAAMLGYDAPWRTRAGKPKNPPSGGSKRRARKDSFPQAKEFVAALQFLALPGPAGRRAARHGSAVSGRRRAPFFALAFAGELRPADLTHLAWAVSRQQILPLALAGMALAVATLAFRLATTHSASASRNWCPTRRVSTPSRSCASFPGRIFPQACRRWSCCRSFCGRLRSRARQAGRLSGSAAGDRRQRLPLSRPHR